MREGIERFQSHVGRFSSHKLFSLTFEMMRARGGGSRAGKAEEEKAMVGLLMEVVGL